MNRELEILKRDLELRDSFIKERGLGNEFALYLEEKENGQVEENI